MKERDVDNTHVSLSLSPWNPFNTESDGNFTFMSRLNMPDIYNEYIWITNVVLRSVCDVDDFYEFR